MWLGTPFPSFETVEIHLIRRPFRYDSIFNAISERYQEDFYRVDQVKKLFSCGFLKKDSTFVKDNRNHSAEFNAKIVLTAVPG